jgi:uncharacterized oxidoreductase
VYVASGFSRTKGWMKIFGNTVLITGGATRIGFALAEALLDQGNEVIVCGRPRARLEATRHVLQ